MNKNDVAVLDFGSGKITCLVAQVSGVGDYTVKAVGQSKYSGFCGGVWYESDKLLPAVEFAVRQAEDACGSAIKHLYVGVPGEFTQISTSEAALQFRSKKKITDDDLSEIFAKADIYGKLPGLTAISRSATFYYLDEKKRVSDPVGMVSSRLTGIVSFAYVTEYFMTTVDEVLDKLGITHYEPVLSCLAEALYLIEPHIRDELAILIDVGFITTSVMLVGGDGLLFLKSFSLGGGYITGDLCRVLDIPYHIAEQLTAKINLNLEFEEDNSYTLENGVSVNAKRANEIAVARIDDIADAIIEAFSYCEVAIPESTTVGITGGGLTYFRGAVEYLSLQLGKPLYIAASRMQKSAKPENASALGLLEIAARQIKSRRLFKFKF